MSKKKQQTKKTKKPSTMKRLARYAQHRTAVYWQRGLWQKIIIIVCALMLVLVTLMYSIASWYKYSHRNEPLVIGATFIPNYARYFELDPKETLQAMLYELGLRDIRLVSYWSNGEPKKDQYDFEELDWQFDMVEEAGGTVSLAIGLRQPRWPECHMPDWARELPKDQWYPQLKEYMGRVIERYKDRPSLQSYQLENEYFLEVFGECPDHSEERLIDEFNFVKSLDPDTTLIVSRSNNAVPSWPVGEPRADLVGASIYKRVWDKTVTKRYFEYPIPAWFYAFLAGGAELTTGRNTFIHELQTEAWTPGDLGGLKEAPIEEQNKSFTAEDIGPRIDYAIATGMKRIDLWGVEWWYFRMIKKNDPSLWDAAAEKLRSIRITQQH